MKLAMRAASSANVRVVVLDRPNPLGGLVVEGPLRSRTTGLVRESSSPTVRHGMTIGELAKLFAADAHLELSLDVVRAKNWRRRDELGPHGPRVGAPLAEPALDHLGAPLPRRRPPRGDEPLRRARHRPPVRDLRRALARSRGPRREAEGARAFPSRRLLREDDLHADDGRVRGKAVSRSAIADCRAFEAVRTGVAIALALRDVAGSTWTSEGLNRVIGDRATTEAIRAGK